METRFYRAGELRPLVAISGDGRLEAVLELIFVGWCLVPVTAGGAMDAEIRIAQESGRWTCSAPWGEAPVSYGDPVSAACQLIADLYRAEALADRAAFCLHAAGVLIGGGAVLLAGDYRAGKSVVSVACAAAGHRVYSDDIVPLGPDGRTAIAPGLAIRLRLPLPDGLEAATRAFVAAHRAVAGKRYLYLRPPADRLARRGESAPVRAIVALERREDGPARLHALSRADALAHAIRRNFARQVPAGRILEVFGALVEDIPLMRLRYRSAEEAVWMLERALDGVAPALPVAPHRCETAGRAGRAGAEIAPDTVIRRAAGGVAREQGGQVFLADPAGRTIVTLNPTAAGVWNLAAEPCRFRDLVSVFAEAFPDRAPDVLAADLSKVVRGLAGTGILALDTASAQRRLPPARSAAKEEGGGRIGS